MIKQKDGKSNKKGLICGDPTTTHKKVLGYKEWFQEGDCLKIMEARKACYVGGGFEDDRGFLTVTPC